MEALLNVSSLRCYSDFIALPISSVQATFEVYRCPSSTCCVFIFWKYGLLTEWGSEREEIREVVGLSRFVAYIPNKECWKPVRDQSYSPKGLTARCPRNTFKASNSPPDQMQPGNNEKHWPLRLEPVSVRSHSQAVAGGIFLKDKRWNAAKNAPDATISFFWGGGNAPSVSRAKRILYLAFISMGSWTVILTTRIYHFGGQQMKDRDVEGKHWGLFFFF